MFRRLCRRNGQTTLEYAILIGVIVAGLVGMQVYLKRGFSGKLKESADSMGQQFSPVESTSNYLVNSETVSNENLVEDITTTNITSQETTRTGDEHVTALTEEGMFGAAGTAGGGVE